MYKHFNRVAADFSIPEQAFLFKPIRSQHDQTPDDFKRYEGESYRRLIFEGWAQDTYTAQEKNKLRNFEEEIVKRGIALDPRWDRPWKLRWLLDCKWDFEETVQAMRKFEDYIVRVKEISFTKKLAEHMRSGLVYMVGRDCHYRPIVVIDVEKVVNFNLNEEEMIQIQTYFFEYIMKNCLIPGQVENWVVLIDSNFQNLMALMGALKNSFIFLSDTYRGRLYSCYNCRINLSLRMIWTLVQKFLDPITVAKIHLYEELRPEKFYEHANRSQFEVKFGGTLPNLKDGEFWPPRGEVSKDYSVPNQKVKLMTQQQYTANYENKILYDTKIHEQLLIKAHPIEMRENMQKKTLLSLEKELKREMQAHEEMKPIIPGDKRIPQFFTESLNYQKLLLRDRDLYSHIQ